MYFLKGNYVNFGYFYCVRVQVIFIHNSRNGTAKRLVKSMYITTGVSEFYSNVLKSTKKMIFRYKGRDFNAKSEMFRDKHMQNAERDAADV